MVEAYQCEQVGCSLVGKDFRLINGAPYCDAHYRQILVQRLHAAHERWTREDHLSEDDWKVISRTFAELHHTIGNSFLSRARLRDRAFDIRRVDGGFEFKITRHLNAFVNPAKMKRVIETWRANNSDLGLTLVGTRSWKEGDPDPRLRHEAN